MNAAIETDDVTTYMVSGRNRHLPEVVRLWIATGEGVEQDEVLDIQVRNYRERSSFDVYATPHCECCGRGLPEGHYPVRVKLAESATCNAVDETIETCRGCAEEWVEAQETLDGQVPS